ncbi:hypothetical protein NPIL_164231, partial [Nephila pilipes]
MIPPSHSVLDTTVTMPDGLLIKISRLIERRKWLSLFCDMKKKRYFSSSNTSN